MRGMRKSEVKIGCSVSFWVSVVCVGRHIRAVQDLPESPTRYTKKSPSELQLVHSITTVQHQLEKIQFYRTNHPSSTPTNNLRSTTYH